MTLLEISIYAVTGFAAGVVNAVAGGGTFFTFAAMVAFGIPTLNANATSAISLVPGSFAATIAYWPDTRKQWRRALAYALLGVFGGIVGASLLIAIGDENFRALVPWLLGMATGVFALGPSLRRLGGTKRGSSGGGLHIAAYALMLVAGIYGGFFGAGVGIMMLAALSLIGIGDFHTANALKNIVGSISQTVAVVLFLFNGLVFWQEAAVVTIACIAGGYLGVIVSRRVPESIVRAFVVAVGAVLTVIFFFNE